MLNQVFQLANTEIINIAINSSIFILVLFLSIFFIFRMKIDSKGYKLFFVSYIFFWIPLKMLREYTSIVQTPIDSAIMWLPLAAYGFVGIFCRPLVDWISTVLKNRKIILYGAIGIGIISFIPMIFVQTTATNTIQTIGVGIGASMIGTYELMFKEQYTDRKSFLTVSIMAIPPLLADFVSAPVQGLVSTFAKGQDGKYDPSILSYLWIIGIAFYIVTLLMVLFVKEDRSKVGSLRYNNIIPKTSNGNIFYILICLVGTIVAFVKFSNSGATATAQLNLLVDINNKDYPNNYIDKTNLISYVSVIFSSFQLLGTLFLQLVLIKKFSKNTSFLIGIGIWIGFYVATTIYINPYFYFALTSLNGFSYGILYNLILAYVLSLSFQKYKINPIGIYQGVLSIGICASSFFTSFLKAQFTSLDNNLLINLTTIGVLILSGLAFILITYLDKKNQELSKLKTLVVDKSKEYKI